MNKGTAIVGFFLCFLAGMGLMWGVDRSQGNAITAESGAAAGLDQSASPIPVTAKDPQWGDPTAPVTIVEISDFECPFCKRVGPTTEQIQKTYGPKQVRFVWKNNPLPFHKQARPAAEAAETVFQLGGNDAFWKFHDLAFENQGALGDDNYAKWAGQAGVDVAKFKADYGAKKYAAKVDADLAFSSKIGASGTPNFRINGVEVSGAQPFENFKKVIDEQLAEAKKALAAGTKAEDIYVEMTKKNFAAPPEKPAAPAADNKPPEEDKTIWKAEIFKDDPILGKNDALVTIIEYSDFQCPFCKRVEETIEKVRETYKDDVRIVWKDSPLPFHPRAKPAAELAWTAYKTKGVDAFWKAHKALFDSQPKLEDDDLKTIAQQLGLDWTTVKANIDSNKYDSFFQATMAQGADLNARGTPHFFINGYRVTGAQPFEKFKEVIDAQLAKAKAMVAAGTPRAKVYETIMAEAKGPPPPEKKTVPAPTAKNPSKGPANAKVVIQMWSDFQCPFCKRVEPTLTQLEKEYGGKVRVVWRNMPLSFHADAPLAAEAAMEAFAQKGNDGFWKFHAALFESQPNIKRPDLERIAQEQGLDMTKFKAALDGSTHKAQIDADNEAGTKAGISGTPAFVIGDYYLSGAQPDSAFRKLINLVLAEKR
ncbi:MAG: thioredoxin domain-containing protein [Sorangiineae bacterium]|nr:thioredoxin domain-containing protein [Polyangiaceae bacterium]MEB2323218.1 thioredoxin domain-containing protein [Sorangiineae bacterium]